MSSKFKYNAAWETEFDWLKPSKMSESYALCTFCKQYFKINGYGKNQVVRHSKSQNHLQIEKNRKRNHNLVISAKTSKCASSSPFAKLSKDEELINAEIIWTLKTIDSNYSFNSSYQDCCALFKLMFPDSVIVRHFDLDKAKVKYLAQFGIVPHIERIIKSDMLGSPFSIIFDETQSPSQAKKQYDVYIQYWSNLEDKFVPAIYCGSIFLGHCRIDVLKNNFFEFAKKLNIDLALLIQISLTGPSNLKFLKLVIKELEESHFTSVLDFGSCCVHPVCAALKKGLGHVNFAYEEFLNDLIYFLKFALRKDDEKGLAIVAEISHKFFLAQTPSKWLFLKPALSRVLDHYKSIRDYFLIFLPKLENFKRELESTNKYKHMVKLLKDRRTLIYLNFIISVTCIFEPLLFDFLKREPLMHSLHENLSKLLFDLMSNFLKRSVLVKAGKKLDGDSLGQIDCRNTNLHLQNVALNLSTRKEIGLSSLNAKCISDLQEEFLQFYIESTTYLQNKLPLNSDFLKDLKHLHPSKRNSDAIARTAKTLLNIVRNENVLNRLFHTQGKDKNALCDIIVNQAKMYIVEKDLPHENLQEHWKHVNQIKNTLGEKKYQQLYILVKCVMVLSHGNSASERGCIINHNILEKNKNMVDEDTICAIRLIKDYLNHIGGIERFVVNREIIKTVKASQKKYIDYLDKRKSKKKR